MDTNKIYNIDCIKGIAHYIDTETIDLVIADPPYFKVVGEKWDYQWRTEDDYLAWSRLWINEVSRVLRKGGSFYLFGYFRILSRLLPILEENGFELRQQIVLNKGIQAVSGRATKNYKIFPNVTESILFLYKDPKPFVKDFLKLRQSELGYTSKQINEQLGVKSNGGGMWSIYTGKNICKQLPTEEYWSKLQNILSFDIPYSKISQTYNAQMGLTDVWNDINFYGEKSRIHPTQKPLDLITRLISASSNDDDIVLDPFIGSGTTAISCIKNNRFYIGFENNFEYYNAARARIDSSY
ncbi:MAG: site-specific DNA-methyltransferase [Oscillospiraceae bacterium]